MCMAICVCMYCMCVSICMYIVCVRACACGCVYIHVCVRINSVIMAQGVPPRHPNKVICT